MSMVLMNLADIQGEIEAIAKTQRNTDQGWMFRGVEDVLNSIHCLLAKYRVVVSVHKVGEGRNEERKTKSGGVLITRINEYTFDFVAVDGSVFTVGPLPGEGMDPSDKASNKTMANAYKYCMFFTFSIPTHDLIADPDAESPEAGDGNGKTKASGGKGNPKTSGKSENRETPPDPRQELISILDKAIATGDKELMRDAEGAKKSMQNIKDQKSLQNFLNLWKKKLAALPPTPEAEAVQGEFVNPEDPGVSKAFDGS